MLTIRQAWIGLLILFFVALLVVVAATYWQHVTGVNFLNVLADVPLKKVPKVVSFPTLSFPLIERA